MSSPRNCGRAGVAVTLWRAEAPRAGHRCGDRGGRMRGRAARRSPTFAPAKGWLVVDALFGAGLARPLDGVYAEAIARLDAAGARGRRRRPAERRVGPERRGARHRAAGPSTTVTFFRKKPGHLLYPGRTLLRRDDRRRYRHSRRRACGDPAGLRRERSGELAAPPCRRLPPTPTNMRAAMSACFPAGRPRPARRGLRRWRRRAPGQGR